MKGTLLVFILQGLSLLVVGKNYVSESPFPTKDFYIKSDMIAKCKFKQVESTDLNSKIYLFTF